MWKYSPANSNAWYQLPSATDEASAKATLAQKGILDAHAEVALGQFDDDGTMTHIDYVRSEKPKTAETAEPTVEQSMAAAAQRLAGFCLPILNVGATPVGVPLGSDTRTPEERSRSAIADIIGRSLPTPLAKK